MAAGVVVVSDWGDANFQEKGWLFREGAVPSSGVGSALCPGEWDWKGGGVLQVHWRRLVPSQGVARLVGERYFPTSGL